MRIALCFKQCRWLLPLILTAMLGLCACNTPANSPNPTKAPESLIVSATAETVTCRLPGGGVAILPKKPRRAVILLTSLLEPWMAAGGPVIARCSGRINVPPAARDLPVVGTFSNPNVEKIIALQPDLVLGANVGHFQAMMPILEQNKIPCACFDYVNYHDYIRLSALFAAINGTQEQFRTTQDSLTAEVAAIVGQCRRFSSPKVLILFTTSHSITCELSDSQTGLMVEMLGGHNIIPTRLRAGNETRVDFSLERIVQLDPDIILLNTMGDATEGQARLKKVYETNAAWASLRAVREDRFFVLPKKYFLYKPNNAFPDALRYLARLLYPDFEPTASGRPTGRDLSRVRG